MTTPITDRKIFSLLEVTRSIQKTLSERYGSSFWVKAEMNKLNYYPHSGHCYPELVEKRDGKVIAQLRSNLWKDDYMRINRTFLEVVKAPLKDGITMLFCAKVAFDPVHGLSLRILDIDPIFTLGELEREKAETVAALRGEGIFDSNRSLKFPLLPKRAAIISVETSKGYADFQEVITGNPGGYRFTLMLFPSVLQGERAVDSIRYQLSRIRRVADHFDVVAIIRGGGGEVGLSCFNNLDLCRDIARFPIPVITGIGHATNETVAELVAFRNAITPTDLANFLISRFDEFATPVMEAAEKLRALSKEIVRAERSAFSNAVRYFRSVTGNILLSGKHRVEGRARSLIQFSRFLVAREKSGQASETFALQKAVFSYLALNRQELRRQLESVSKDASTLLRRRVLEMESFEKSVHNMSPDEVLKRGYSITRINGAAIKTTADVKTGDKVTTTLASGMFESEIKSVNEKAG